MHRAPKTHNHGLRIISKLPYTYARVCTNQSELAQCLQHLADPGPVLASYGMFTGYLRNAMDVKNEQDFVRFFILTQSLNRFPISQWSPGGQCFNIGMSSYNTRIPMVSSLDQVMAWCQIGTKPLPEPMMTVKMILWLSYVCNGISVYMKRRLLYTETRSQVPLTWLQ